jgi:hypothetical protein
MPAATIRNTMLAAAIRQFVLNLLMLFRIITLPLVFMPNIAYI